MGVVFLVIHIKIVTDASHYSGGLLGGAGVVVCVLDCYFGKYYHIIR